MTHVYQPQAGGFAYFNSGVINGPLGVGGTWSAYSTWTLPALTLGGTVTSNGQSFSGTIANLGTVTTVDLNGGTIDGTTIGGASAAAGTFTTVAATTGNITTVNATTVDTTSIEVTNLKAKDGTSAGSIADTTGVVTLASSVLTTTDINGGTIDGTVIGGASAAAGTFTTLTATGNAVVGSGQANASLNIKSSVADGGAGYSELLLGNSTQPTDSYVSYNHATGNLLIGVQGATVGTWNTSGLNGVIGATTPAAGTFTDLTSSGNTVLGNASTDTLNVGNGGIIKDASGNVGIGVTPSFALHLNSGQFAGPDGTAGAPTYSFASSGNSDNGMYLSANNVLSFAVAGTKTLTVQADRLEFASGYHVTSATATGTTPAIQSGTYTPTITGTSNFTSGTANAYTMWYRLGNIVTVIGRLTVRLSGSTSSAFRVSLPISSNFTDARQLLGEWNWQVSAPPIVGTITGDTTNDAASFYIYHGIGSGSEIEADFRFSYEVV